MIRALVAAIILALVAPAFGQQPSPIEQRLKSQLGELLFANAALSAEVDILRAEVAELKRKAAEDAKKAGEAAKAATEGK